MFNLDENFINIINVTEELKELNNDENLLLILCGVSGSGKSTFESMLIQNAYFNKLPQITTREPREGETSKNYYFVNNKVYNNLKDKLIARIPIVLPQEYINNESEDTVSTYNMFPNKYGTIPVFKNNCFNTVIASADAINDMAMSDSESLNGIVPHIIFFDIDFEDIPKEALRKGRDLRFINFERWSLYNIIAKNYDLFASVNYYKITKNEDNTLKYPEISTFFTF